MPDYTNSKIYKLVDNTNGSIYIGSTTKKLIHRRKVEHARDYRRFLQGHYNYTTSFQIIENGDYDIHLIESCPCSTKEELSARERFHIENNRCVNRYVSGRMSRSEYHSLRSAYRKTWGCDNSLLDIDVGTFGTLYDDTRAPIKVQPRVMSGQFLRSHFGDRYCNPIKHISLGVFK